jgi:hypothetical protein
MQTGSETRRISSRSRNLSHVKSRLLSAFQNLCGALAVVYSVIALGRAMTDAPVILAAAAIFLLSLTHEWFCRDAQCASGTLSHRRCNHRMSTGPLTLALYPLLVAAELFVEVEAMRLLVAGVALAVAVAVVLVRSLDDGWRIPRHVALLVASVLAVSFSLLPLTKVGVAYAVAMGVAVAILIFISSDDDSITLPTFATALLVVFVTPHEPLRAQLFPFVVAATLFALRHRSRKAAIVAIVVALLAGKWALPIAAIALLAFRRTKESARPMLVFPGGAALVDLSRMTMLAPSFARALFRVQPTIALGSLLLVVAAAVTGRPQLTTLFVVAALFIVTTGADERKGAGRALRVPTGLVDRDAQLMIIALAVCVVPFAWSGAIARTFPLPAPPSVAIMFAVIIAALSFRRLPPLPAASIAAGALVFIALEGLPMVSDGTSHEPIARGQSVSAAMPRPAEKVVVAISGANLTGLDPATPLGRIEWVTHDGRGFSRELFVREVADWGAFRSGASFRSENPLPRLPAGMLNGRGRDSWLRGTGAIALEGRDIELVRVIADEQLREPAALIIERIDPVNE